MFNVVYYHPTARIAGAMVVKAAEQAIESGVLSAEDVMAETDEGLLLRLKSAGSSLAGRVFERRLFKKAAVVDTSQNAAAKEFFSRKSAAGELDSVLSAAGLSREDYVACLPLPQSRKLSARLVRSDGGFEDLTANSGLMRALEGERRESHFVLGVCEEKRVAASRAVERLLV